MMVLSTSAEQNQIQSGATNDVIIEAKAVSKHFGSEIAINEVSFQIPPGKIFGFIGPSGSGKTTMIRLLAGIYKPTAGDVSVLGLRPSQFTRQTRERIGYMPQLFVLYPGLTVWENLSFVASIYGMGLQRGARLKQALDFVELGGHKNKLARTLSGGMQRRLGLAATLVNDPELIFLDEPTAGIDPVLRQKFWGHFRELRDKGRTLFVTTQYVGEAAYCDLVGVLVQGRLLVMDTPTGLRHRAFGGEIVDLRTKERLDRSYLEILRGLPFVTGKVTRPDEQGTIVRLIVDEASTAMPALLDWCKEQNVAIESIEEHLPPFDDIFVALVKKEAAHG
ncbi:MAG: ABC transporter ATP-binding protein [Anaerolineae bacterium]|nr:ABC transporter ATP-binding protein [Anaerolineae bacterium]